MRIVIGYYLAAWPRNSSQYSAMRHDAIATQGPAPHDRLPYPAVLMGVRMLVGGLLMFAAALKGLELADLPGSWGAAHERRGLLAGQAVIEASLALWIVSNWRAMAACRVALGLFCALSFVALCRALARAPSCGCFGQLAVHPWLTTALDVCVVGALAFCVRSERRHAAAQPDETSGRPQWTYATLPAAIVLALWANYYAVTLGGNPRLIEHESWIGHRWPLLDDIDIGDQLERGDWRVILVRHDCPDCQEAMRSFQSARDDDSTSITHTAFIELPPFGQRELSRVGRYAIGRLTGRQTFFIETPLEVRLTEGRVDGVGTPK